MNYEFNYDTLCVSQLYKCSLLKAGTVFLTTAPSKQTLLKKLALETLDVFWNVVA